MNRYEHEHPGDLINVDVKKLGLIPDGGGWRAHGRSEEVRGRGIGCDYVHAAVDDHPRLAYAEIHPDERGVTAAGFFTRAAAYFRAHGVTRIERALSDNALAYRKSTAFKAGHRKSNASTGPWQRSGPTGNPSPAITPEPRPLLPG